MRTALNTHPTGRTIVRLLTVICGLVLFTSVSLAQTLSLSRDQAIALARQAYLSGDAMLAHSIVTTIAKADPRDIEALLILTASTKELGRPIEAVGFGRRAWSAAKQAGRPAELRYEIAQQTAHAALTADQKRRAAFWLKRAVDVAPNPAARSQSKADLRFMSAQIPLSFSASLKISPTNNLNNGATTGLLIVQDQVVGSISGWSVAHSGYITAGRVGAEYDFGITATGRARNALGFDLSATLHTLNPSEAASNPSLDAQDLDIWTARLRWIQERVLPGAAFADRAPMRISLEMAQSWYGGQPYSPALRGQIDVPLTAANRSNDLTLVAIVERQWQDAPSNVVNGASLHLEGRKKIGFPGGPAHLSYGFGASTLRSGWSNTTYDSLDASVTLAPSAPLGPVQSQLGIGVSWRNYDEYSLGFANVTQGRTDQSLWISAGFGLKDVKLAGLTPTLTVQRQMTWSNISKYQTDSTSLYLGLAADF